MKIFRLQFLYKYPGALPILLALILFQQAGCQDPSTTTTQPNPNNAYSIGLLGDKLDVTTTTNSGIVLMGGSTDVDEAMKWMIEKSGGGDFMILRASGSVGYNSYLYNLGELNSVETLLIDSKTKAQSEAVGKRIREAEAVFIAGGDQANYINFWNDTEVSRALHYLPVQDVRYYRNGFTMPKMVR
jgi:cyanophycinase-like exopeptidase